MTEPRDARSPRTLDELEASARVAFDDQVAEHDPDPPREYLEPEEYDRLRLLNDPAGAGRLRPRS
jgi:hypothetical protein